MLARLLELPLLLLAPEEATANIAKMFDDDIYIYVGVK
jgi:hypothetical protein